MASFKMPFSFWIDSVADCIAEMMIEEAVNEIKAEPVMTSLAELINNLPEDCSQMIYKKVMSDCIQSIPQQVINFYEDILEDCHFKTYALEKKIDGLHRRYKKCKNKKASDDKEEAYLLQMESIRDKGNLIIRKLISCPRNPARPCTFDKFRD